MTDAFSDYLTMLQHEAVRLAECLQRIETLDAFGVREWGEINQEDFKGENDHITPDSLETYLAFQRDLAVFWENNQQFVYPFLRQAPIKYKG